MFWMQHIKKCLIRPSSWSPKFPIPLGWLKKSKEWRRCKFIQLILVLTTLLIIWNYIYICIFQFFPDGSVTSLSDLILIVNDNNPLALQTIESQGLPTDCWSHFQLSADRGKRSSHKVESACHCWLSKLRLPIQLNSYHSTSWKQHT